MTLDEVLAVSWTSPPRRGSLGTETAWLDFCTLRLCGKRLMIIDASFAPSDQDGLLVELAPGDYLLQAKVIDYVTDKRVSRVRVTRCGSAPILGDEIGTTWTDTATTGLCDYETFTRACGGSCDLAYAVVGPTLEDAGTHGVAILDADAGAVMPFLSSGFGDGRFPVFELLQDGQRVGVEVEFIAKDEAYPF